MENLTIYIGYDAREDIAVEKLVKSIRKYQSQNINVKLLKVNSLRHSGLYRRSPHINSTCWGTEQDGIMRDSADLKPFSTDFSFSRFLVPFLNVHQGWALFMDCDMFFRTDPVKLFKEYNDSKYAVYCVHHNQEEKKGLKMYGCPQTSYSRKNWSSFVLWNCEHPSHKNLTVDDVSTKSGNWLHNFRWLADEEIGEIDHCWNWLDDSSSPEIEPANVHFTTGGPWFKRWKPTREVDARYAEEWKNL